uniref:(northern house mosquito) hypothetical protein n=1 Tax=Culex pipiens TaxID=7175 RepID=A0A8D8FV25_CULPI
MSSCHLFCVGRKRGFWQKKQFCARPGFRFLLSSCAEHSKCSSARTARTARTSTVTIELIGRIEIEPEMQRRMLIHPALIWPTTWKIIWSCSRICRTSKAVVERKKILVLPRVS